MRWSLVLFACVFLQCALALFSYALVLPRSPDPRSRRPNPKAHSSQTRNAALSHVDKVSYTKNGHQISAHPISDSLPVDRKTYLKTEMREKDADHILESQVLLYALGQQHQEYGHLDPDLEAKIKVIFNSSTNLALVDRDINQMGQNFQAAIRGKIANVRPHNMSKIQARDDYIRKTAKHAAKTARDIDKLLREKGLQGNVHETLLELYRRAGFNDLNV